MKPLPETYRKNSYDFKLVSRIDDVAIYEQREPENNRLLGYEVFLVHKQTGEAFGKKLEEKEVTPGNSEWGYNGFTVHTLEAAKQKQSELLARVKKMLEKRESANESFSHDNIS